MLSGPTTRVFAPVLALAVGSAAACYAEDARAHECFDAKVTARITAQVPTDLPQPDDGSIVMQWPWFIDLQVRRGDVSTRLDGKVTTQALQHTYWRSDLGFRRWLLRRNNQGGFNLLGLAEKTTLKRCAENAVPATAYVKSEGEGGLTRLREEGERRYGRHPN